MTTQEIRSVLTISLLAAYADSDKHAREREEIRRIAEGLSQADEVNLPTLYQDVLLKRTNLAQAIAGLPSMESRQLAYEMAVCVCDADGSTSERERAFLGELHQALGLEQQFAQQTLHDGEAMAQAPLQAAADAPVAAPPTAPAAATAQPAGRPSTLDEQAMKQKILRAATLNGAIELLPESLSTMAIIPLQMRLVYQIGQSYGYELDKGHIRDFLATIGVGMTSQYLEQAGRKLLGGLLGKAGKGLLGGLGKQAVSSGMSFAATYALGHVANQYYAAGRSISAQMLKDSYAHMLQDGRQLHTQYLPDMRQQAQGLNATRLMSLVRGNSQAF
ncbi:GTPase [Vandammella animalimorsus]|uniref:GTPase n=1 Tax=Vandammella animalimorsus TaxID=2029117 RepID=A0A2A2ANT3_9BURK|nr:TerB family tellurite resistance protein [Vandammella animalimorsus]PAT39486.1 GTPase [Vandammella animalimorsus]